MLPELDDFYLTHSELVGNLIPIGFSRDGKFAYLYESSNEGIDYYNCHFVLRDLRSDSTVLELIHRGEIPNAGNWKSMMAEMRAIYEVFLQKYGIVKGTFELQSFPIHAGADQIAPRVEKSVYPPGTIFYADRFLKAAEVFLVHSRLGEKSVAKIDLRDWMAFGYDQVGYLQSPYEDRVVLIMMRTTWGWEGGPSTLDFELCGAHLSTHFTPPAP